MTTKHYMSLNVPSFERIRDGSKVIELRLYDEKRQLIQIGDEIAFKPAEGVAEAIETKVTALLRYPTFASMIDDLPLEWFGNPDKQALKQGVYQHYNPEDERRNGVLGIRITKI